MARRRVKEDIVGDQDYWERLRRLEERSFGRRLGWKREEELQGMAD